MVRAFSCAVILAIGLSGVGGRPGFTKQPAATEILGGPGGSSFSDSEPLNLGRASWKCMSGLETAWTRCRCLSRLPMGALS